MYLGHIDVLNRLHIEELQREAELARQANRVIRPGRPVRPVRSRIADWLVALAERVEGQPRGSIARAEA